MIFILQKKKFKKRKTISVEQNKEKDKKRKKEKRLLRNTKRGIAFMECSYCHEKVNGVNLHDHIEEKHKEYCKIYQAEVDGTPQAIQSDIIEGYYNKSNTHDKTNMEETQGLVTVLSTADNKSLKIRIKKQDITYDPFKKKQMQAHKRSAKHISGDKILPVSKRRKLNNHCALNVSTERKPTKLRKRLMNKNDKKHGCGKCGKPWSAFRDETAVALHMEAKHTYVCHYQQCPLRFTRFELLDEHRRLSAHYNTKSRNTVPRRDEECGKCNVIPEICSKCHEKKNRRRLGEWKRHLNMAHSLPCPYSCGVMFASHISRAKHVRLMHKEHEADDGDEIGTEETMHSEVKPIIILCENIKNNAPSLNCFNSIEDIMYEGQLLCPICLKKLKINDPDLLKQYKNYLRSKRQDCDNIEWLDYRFMSDPIMYRIRESVLKYHVAIHHPEMTIKRNEDFCSDHKSASCQEKTTNPICQKVSPPQLEMDDTNRSEISTNDKNTINDNNNNNNNNKKYVTVKNEPLNDEDAIDVYNKNKNEIFHNNLDLPKIIEFVAKTVERFHNGHEDPEKILNELPREPTILSDLIKVTHSMLKTNKKYCESVDRIVSEKMIAMRALHEENMLLKQLMQEYLPQIKVEFDEKIRTSQPHQLYEQRYRTEYLNQCRENMSEEESRLLLSIGIDQEVRKYHQCKSTDNHAHYNATSQAIHSAKKNSVYGANNSNNAKDEPPPHTVTIRNISNGLQGIIPSLRDSSHIDTNICMDNYFLPLRATSTCHSKMTTGSIPSISSNGDSTNGWSSLNILSDCNNDKINSNVSKNDNSAVFHRNGCEIEAQGILNTSIIEEDDEDEDEDEEGEEDDNKEEDEGEEEEEDIEEGGEVRHSHSKNQILKKWTEEDDGVKLNVLLESLSGANLMCLQCAKTFQQKVDLQKHVKDEHVCADASNVCAVCDKTFQQRTNLVCHMSTHLSNPTLSHPFKCLICEKGSTRLERTFTRKSSLRRHVAVKHPSCDKNAPWIVAQTKPKIAKEMCAQLNAQHLTAKKYTDRPLESLTMEFNEITETKSLNSNSNKSVDRIFPEIFLLQNLELFEQLVSSNETISYIGHTDSLSYQDPSVPPTSLPDSDMNMSIQSKSPSSIEQEKKPSKEIMKNTEQRIMLTLPIL